MLRPENILTHIYHDLLKALADTVHCDLGNDSLFQGSWGALLYLFYYENYVDETEDNASELLGTLYGRIHLHEEADFSYATGFSGVLWLLSHLQRHSLIDLDLEDIAPAFIKGAILDSRRRMSKGDFDFLGGCAGICYVLTFFMDRPEVRAHLEEFAEVLSRMAVETEQGLSFPVYHFHTGAYTMQGSNAFGMSHGSCSLRMILCRIHGAGIATETCKRLIYGNVQFTFSARNPDTSVSLYPLAATGNEKLSRLSWCYGDMGVALSLWLCGRYFKEALWMNEATGIMRHNAKRIATHDTGIKDACLCHGTAGIAVIYHQFWQETGDPLFRDTAAYWYEQTLQQASFPENADGNSYGTRVWNGAVRDFQYACNVLDGSSGVGLAILSQNFEGRLPWSEFLMI